MTNLNKEWCIQERLGISSGRGNVHLVKSIGGLFPCPHIKNIMGHWTIMSTLQNLSGGLCPPIQKLAGGDIVRTVMLAAQ